ncbi:MAG: hypothetical protein LBH47_00275 [Christensenellaceae bacterium]|nr:hypothetical protein [Christensenellaceae bacterium]
MFINLFLELPNWAWLLIGLAFMALLWAGIKGSEWLVEYTREHDRIVKEGMGAFDAELNDAEQDYKKHIEYREKVIKHANMKNEDLIKEIGNLGVNELTDVLFERLFGDDKTKEENTKKIKAEKSAFVEGGTRVVDQPQTVSTIFGKKNTKISKEDKKILNEIKKK